MAYESCPKCVKNGKNPKTAETCTCVVNTIPRNDCVVCKGTGKAPCFSCGGSGTVYIGNKP